MHIHILGVAGTFMGGIAQIARMLGVTVTGSDRAVYPPMSTALEKAGIEVSEGYEAEKLPEADMYVIGNAIGRGNPMLERILNERRPYISGPQWLCEHVLASRRVLAVAGTHGKTTTTSMLTWILKESGLTPGFLIGGVPAWGGGSADLGDPHAPFVIEADEYDTCFCDKRSKFVHYRPWTAIFNNLEFDHADIFENVGQIETQFHHLVKTIPSDGTIVMNAGYETLERVLARGVYSHVERFADPQGWHVKEGASGPVIYQGDVEVAPLVLNMTGQYNWDNALAAILAAQTVGVSFEEALEGLASFPGVKRRQEVVGVVRDITVMDDFAHHPTAVEVTIAGVKRRVAPGGRLLAIMEPRSNTMKMGTMKDALAPALAGADLVFAYQPPHVTWSVRDAMAPLGDKAFVTDDFEALVGAICQEARPGDTLLVMSNGAFGGIHTRLLKALK